MSYTVLAGRKRVNPADRVMMEIQEQDAPSSISTRTGQRIQKEFDRGVEFSAGRPRCQISKYIGTSMASQKTKKRKKSSAMKTPSIPVWPVPGTRRNIPSHAVLDGGPGRENRDQAQQRGQHDEQERDAVDAEDVTCADGGNPIVRRAFNELELSCVAALHQFPKSRHQRQGN